MKFEMKREILVVLNPNGFAQAPFLSGVLAFARHHPRLNVTIDDAPASFDLAKLNSYLDEGVDGVIVSETGIVDLPQILNQTRVPIVVFGSPKPCTRKSNIAFVMSNDTGIGIAAARHFFNLGRFRDFAFIPCQGRGWSEKELHGFDAFLKRKRMTAKVFSGSSRGELSDFLRGLNKPAAVMGADDPTALKAVFACRAANLAIPLQVAILGVNDNTVICNGISPTLSSIYVDHENEGYLAAKHLMGMIRRPDSKSPNLIRPTSIRIVERESTRQRSPSASLIERAFDYINRHIRQKITVSDIVKTLGISQRLVELRFKEQLGVSLVQTILAQRLEYLRKELLQSSQPASAVAAACGFSDMAYLTRVFKRRFGTTPAACRRLKPDNIS